MANLIKKGTKIIGIGRNYVDSNPTPMPKEPVLFLKPASSYLANGGTIKIPASMEHLWYEAELAVVIGKKACDYSESEALDYVAGYALGLDMTAKEFQATIKATGLPWL
ncbi:putative acylpyruvase FAHD1 mitochondrial [Bienertia sinuspersici]